MKSTQRAAADQQQTLEVRSHVLSLREGELESRLRDRDSTLTALNQQLRDVTLMLRKEQATREALTRQVATSTTTRSVEERPKGRPRAPRGVRHKVPNNNELLARRQPRKKPPGARTPPVLRAKRQTRRAGPLRRPKPTTAKRKTAKKRPPAKRKQLHQHLATVIAKTAGKGPQ